MKKIIKKMILATSCTAWVIAAGATAHAGNGTVTYHTHEGNNQEGGGCFQTPVYHVHEGNEAEGGTCYATPVYHLHEGNETEGGSCYQTMLLHEHEGDEVTGGGCYAAVYHTHTGSCYSEGSHTSSCPSHIEYHPYDCRTVHDWDGDGHGCDGFTAYDCGGHRYLSCGKENGLTGYQLSCRKNTDSVESYVLSCEKTDETIEHYEFTCEKEEGDLDYYDNTCGMKEGEAIYHPDSSVDEEDHSEAYSFEESSGQEESAPLPMMTPTPTPTASPTSQIIEQRDSSGGNKSGQHEGKKMLATPKKEVMPTIRPTSVTEPVYRVEKEQVTMEPVGTELEETVEPVKVQRKFTFFHSPAAKWMTVTTGTVALLGILVALLFVLMRSVRIFNDNGEGRMQYLGRVKLHLSEEGYYLELNDRLLEKAVTNRYLVKTDFFYIGKNSDWEIFIIKDGKKKVVRLQKEINVTI